MTTFIGQIVARITGSAVGVLIGRLVGRQVAGYLGANAIQPYLLPLGGLAVGAAGSAVVLNYMTQRYPGVVAWLRTLAMHSSALFVVVGVVWWTGRQQGAPIQAVVVAVTGALQRIPVPSDDYTGAILG